PVLLRPQARLRYPRSCPPGQLPHRPGSPASTLRPSSSPDVVPGALIPHPGAFDKCEPARHAYTFDLAATPCRVVPWNDAVRKPQGGRMFKGLMKMMRAGGMLPRVSDTERAALEAGTVWIDGEFFRGNPDFARLLAEPYPRLTPEEQALV